MTMRLGWRERLLLNNINDKNYLNTRLMVFLKGLRRGEFYFKAKEVYHEMIAIEGKLRRLMEPTDDIIIEKLESTDDNIGNIEKNEIKRLREKLDELNLKYVAATTFESEVVKIRQRYINIFKEIETPLLKTELLRDSCMKGKVAGKAVINYMLANDELKLVFINNKEYYTLTEGFSEDTIEALKLSIKDKAENKKERIKAYGYRRYTMQEKQFIQDNLNIESSKELFKLFNEKFSPPLKSINNIYTIKCKVRKSGVKVKNWAIARTPEEFKQHKREYYQKNKERFKNHTHNYYLKNKQKILKRSRNRYKESKEVEDNSNETIS
jgi:hypothetical protein